LRRFDLFDIYPATVTIETYNAVYQSENGVIPTQTDIPPRQKLRSALPYNDVPGDHLLAAEFFYTKALANAVASVFDATLTFFVSHASKLQSKKKNLLANRFNLHTSQLATMTHSAMVSLAPLILESDHFFVFELFNHLTDHLCPCNNRITGCDGRSVSEQNHIFKRHLLSVGGCEFVNSYGIPGAHPILLTSRSNNRVRHLECLIRKAQKLP
jgi:hypothetical protein